MRWPTIICGEAASWGAEHERASRGIQAPPPAHAIPITMQPAPNARLMRICFPEKSVFVLNAKNETAL